jgi:signal transduction histidine kinase
MQRLTVLGRFSSQMAHDLKSPLTALLGAVQVLEAVPEGDDRDPRAEAEAKAMRSEFLLLIAEQARRVAAIVARYDEIGRVEPRMTVVRVNDVARAVARAFVLPPASLVLAPGEPECEADRDLLEGAVENVVRNAVEACQEAGMSDASGAVRIETAEDDAAGVLRIRIVDQGPGMDARSRARALDDFFTTKATGSGLGLPFVHRVITAHGGEVHLESEGGRGTTVELVLPARGRHAART